jgi:hypothetical protein
MNIKEDDIPEIIKKERPNLKPISIKQYEAQLKKIKKIFNADDYDFLNNPKDVGDKLSDLHYTSVRNMYNAIIILLMALNSSKKYDKLIKNYSDLRDELNDKYIEEQKSGIISEKQKPNFASMEEIEKMLKQLKSEVNVIKKKSKLNKTDKSTVKAWILFNMLIRIPTRNDASNMLYISQKDYKKLSDDDKKQHNYLVDERNNLKFIYNQYKTSKKWGELVVPVPVDLKPMIRSYIKIMDYKIGDNIFPLTRNALSQLLVKTSKRILNKNISSTMIRKIYMSDKYSDMKQEMEKDAKILGHDVSVGQSVYTKSSE